MNWQCERTAISDNVYRYRLLAQDQHLSWVDAIGLWQESADFTRYFCGLLRDSPFRCYRWEAPALIQSAVSQPFEFVLVQDSTIDLPADSRDFAEQFARQPGKSVIEFANLGGDAVLVVPVPLTPVDQFPHIAAFINTAPESQQMALWRGVASAMHRRLGEKPVWLNTAGGGVPWLHFRLDDRPKYYKYEAYRG